MASLDKSLDEIVASRPKNGRRGSRRGAGSATQSPTPAATARGRYSGSLPAANGARAAVPAVPAAAQPPQATKILVSNLPPDVNEQQIRELFASTVGPLREVNLHFDAKGQSKGVAAVSFNRKGDGNKAYTQYNNRLIDGKRPMKIEIVLDARAIPVPTLSQRVAPAPVAAAAAATANGNGAQNSNKKAPAGRGVRGGRANRKKGTERPVKTAADLDAEMEDYSSNPTTATA